MCARNYPIWEIPLDASSINAPFEYPQYKFTSYHLDTSCLWPTTTLVTGLFGKHVRIGFATLFFWIGVLIQVFLLLKNLPFRYIPFIHISNSICRIAIGEAQELLFLFSHYDLKQGISCTVINTRT